MITPDDSPAQLHILRGPEHGAMERLIQAAEICAAAHKFLAARGEEARASTARGAASILLVLEPAMPKLGAALVASATQRPGGAAQLSRASKDMAALLRELPAFPDSHRVANLPDGHRIVEDTLGDLLRETALELYDVDLEYGVNEAGEHVFTWCEEPQHVVEMMVLETLMLKMDLMLMTDPRLGFEHAAGAWWFKQFTAEWPTDLEAGFAGWRMREWTLADRIVPSLGTTAVEALPHHQLWAPLSVRQRGLVRSFAASIPGLFITRATTARGLMVEDVFDGRRHELVLPESMDTPPSHSLTLGRLVPRDGGFHLPSPGTVTFAIAADLPDQLVALLREHGTRDERAQYAEAMMTRLRGGAAIDDRVNDLTPAGAAEMLRAYEAAASAARVGKTFSVRGATPREPDDATHAWIDLLRERSAEQQA